MKPLIPAAPRALDTKPPDFPSLIRRVRIETESKSKAEIESLKALAKRLARVLEAVAVRMRHIPVMYLDDEERAEASAALSAAWEMLGEFDEDAAD